MILNALALRASSLDRMENLATSTIPGEQMSERSTLLVIILWVLLGEEMAKGDRAWLVFDLYRMLEAVVSRIASLDSFRTSLCKSLLLMKKRVESADRLEQHVDGLPSREKWRRHQVHGARLHRLRSRVWSSIQSYPSYDRSRSIGGSQPARSRPRYPSPQSEHWRRSLLCQCQHRTWSQWFTRYQEVRRILFCTPLVDFGMLPF